MTWFTLGVLSGLVGAFVLGFFSDLGRKHAIADRAAQEDKAQGYREPAKVSQSAAPVHFSEGDPRRTSNDVLREQLSGPRVVRPSATKFRKACSECNAVFEYTLQDVYGTVTQVKCPACGRAQFHFASNAV
jgi:hypothetical protein